ncbi:hypothetical protein RR48_10938 [Papilio machaon]|uniref:Uncharacterized protein n=1 Tax=Papilio machaon TaxID=76193 RepID=A0A194R8C6_PAPMA|nr:hypothetical protein RR48_10938 [Papilio machaon]
MVVNIILLRVEASSQAITPIGYGSPTVYSQSDEDLGLLLTILMLAGRNKSGGTTCAERQASLLNDEYDDDDDEDDSNEELKKIVLKGDKGKYRDATGNGATIIQEIEVEQEAEGESDDAQIKNR